MCLLPVSVTTSSVPNMSALWLVHDGKRTFWIAQKRSTNFQSNLNLTLEKKKTKNKSAFPPSIWQICAHGSYLLFLATFDFCRSGMSAGRRSGILPVKAAPFRSGEMSGNTLMLLIKVVCPVFCLLSLRLSCFDQKEKADVRVKSLWLFRIRVVTWK